MEYSLKLVGVLIFAAAAPGMGAAVADVLVEAVLMVDYLPLGGQATGERCTVTVQAGSNGVAVLDAAVTAGCIEGYTPARYSFGRLSGASTGLV